MKTSGENGNHATLCQQHEDFGIPDGKEIFMVRTPEQTTHYPEQKNNIIGLSENVQLNLLRAENQKLKTLVEDLIHDKACQAQRITELNQEKSRLKKTIADLIMDNGNK